MNKLTEKKTERIEFKSAGALTPQAREALRRAREEAEKETRG